MVKFNTQIQTQNTEPTFFTTPPSYARSLNNNEIDNIENKSFDELMNLKKLWLTNNRISCVSNTTFSQLTQLQDLLVERLRLCATLTNALLSLYKFGLNPV